MIHLLRKAHLLKALLRVLEEAQDQVSLLIKLEAGHPGADDEELRGILLQLQTIAGQVSGLMTANHVQKDG